MSVKIQPDLRPAMTFQRLTTIGTKTSRPTYFTIEKARKQSLANAQCISYQLYEPYGHMGVLLTDAKFLKLPHMTNPFVAPQYPGPTIPRCDTKASAATVAETRTQYENKCNVFATYQATMKALKTQVLEAVDDQYLGPLNDPEYGFTQVNVYQLYEHLLSTYSTVTHEHRTANTARMTAAWMPPTPFEAFIAQLEDGRHFEEADGMRTPDKKMISIGFAILLKTGKFAADCQLWRKQERAGPTTWSDFTTFFTDANNDIDASTSTGAAGYNEAANGVIPANPPASPAYNTPEFAAQVQLYLQHQQANGAATLPPAPILHYCWSHGLSNNPDHTSATCRHPRTGHRTDATIQNQLNGTQGRTAAYGGTQGMTHQHAGRRTQTQQPPN
jgi:hypothetical protein